MRVCVCVCHCLCFLADIQEIYNIPANFILLSCSFCDIISCFSLLIAQKTSSACLCYCCHLSLDFSAEPMKRYSTAFCQHFHHKRPHLGGSYTVFGRYLYDSMQIVDSLGSKETPFKQTHSRSQGSENQFWGKISLGWFC